MNIGDFVSVKNFNLLNMTINEEIFDIDGEFLGYECVWFSDDGSINNFTFNENVLEPV